MFKATTVIVSNEKEVLNFAAQKIGELYFQSDTKIEWKLVGSAGSVL
jgi:hypothetical protein